MFLKKSQFLQHSRSIFPIRQDPILFPKIAKKITDSSIHLLYMYLYIMITCDNYVRPICSVRIDDTVEKLCLHILQLTSIE